MTLLVGGEGPDSAISFLGGRAAESAGERNPPSLSGGLLFPIKLQDRTLLLNCCHCFNSPRLATSSLSPLPPSSAFPLYFSLPLSPLCAFPPSLFGSVNLFLFSKAPFPSSALPSPLFPLNSSLLLSPKPSSSSSLSILSLAGLCSLSPGPSASPALPATDLLARLEKIRALFGSSKMLPAARRGGREALKGHRVRFKHPRSSAVVWAG